MQYVCFTVSLYTAFFEINIRKTNRQFVKLELSYAVALFLLFICMAQGKFKAIWPPTI